MSTSFAAARGVARAAATSCPRRARRAVARSSSRRASARVAAATSSSSSSSSGVEVITFDLDDTLWPTTPVVAHANQAFVDFCSERIPGFPDTAGVNEYMKRVRAEREALARRDNDRHFPLSFASLRIAAANVAAVELGVNVHDAVSIVSRGYHLAWIPARGEKAAELLFDGAREMLRELRANHPNAAIGSITNGLGSAASAGLGEFFDFEISADELMDSEGVHGEDAKKPGGFMFTRAKLHARAHARGPWSGDASAWVHIGDDVVNDCGAAKTHGGFRTIMVDSPEVVPWPGSAAKIFDAGEDAPDASVVADVVVTSLREIPGVLRGWA